MADLISRAAALEALGECPYNRDDWPEEIQAVDDWKSHKEAIESIPAVDAVPVVHGRWVDADGTPVAWSKALPSSPEDSCVCSVCGTWLVGSDELPVYGLYCPACGAKMDGDA